MINLIDSYSAGWNPNKKQWAIRAKLETGNIKEWTGDDHAEFTAIFTILATSVNTYMTPGGSLSTGKDVPGM
jgi:hypothetical protein